MNVILRQYGSAPARMFLFSTIFCNLILDCCVKTRTKFSLRDKRLFKITEVEITRVDCTVKPVLIFFGWLVWGLTAL